MTSDVTRWLWNQPPRNDATTIMGMQTRGVYILAAGILIMCTIIGFAGGGIENPWLFMLGMLVLSVAAIVLLSAPGDPMALWATMVTATLPSLAIVVVAPAVTGHPGMAWASVTGPLAMILSFIAVRGRVWAAMAGYVLYAAVSVGIQHWVGPAPLLIGPLLPNLAVMLMAVVFAAIVRPRARKIYALRARTARQAAIEASDQAALAVRDNQMAYLDDRARPLLERISAGGPFAADVVAECGLVEAALRDRIRAAGLDTPEIAAAARAARARGARVLLLDDRGTPVGTDAPVPPSLYDAAVAALRSVKPDSTVTIRLLPFGRTDFATVAVARDGVTELVTYGPDGRPHAIE